VFSALPDERALTLGFAQTFGATFNAWLPLLIYNTGTQAPLFKVGYITASSMAGAQAVGVVLLSTLGKRLVRETAEDSEQESEKNIKT
jgi:ACS family pantothenate transporter-like MFS transporter